MNWQNILAVVLGTTFVAFFAKIYSQYKYDQKKLIDLEYKDEKQKAKDAVKNDSIDTIIARISKRFK